jgi:predicted PurR-regulated permease PerM
MPEGQERDKTKIFPSSGPPRRTTFPLRGKGIRMLMEPKKIEISTGIIFRTILILLGLWFLYAIRDVIALLFISVIIVSAIDPAVDWLQKKKIPRAISVLGIYIIMFAVFSLAVSFLIPPIVNQSEEFIKSYSQYSQRFDTFFAPIKDFFQLNQVNLNFESAFSEINKSFSSISLNIFSTTIGVFSGFISILVVLALAFYMAAKEDAVNQFIVSIAPKKHKAYAADLTGRIKDKIGRWMLGQIVLMFIIFVLDSIGLYLVGVPFPLVLGLFAGIMEIVPYMGPIVSAIPGVLLGFMISPTIGFLALLVYLVVQQFENYVIVPQIMKKAVGLNPIAVILALMAGIKLAGVLGAILAIPVATAVGLFIGDLMDKNEN